MWWWFNTTFVPQLRRCHWVTRTSPSFIRKDCNDTVWVCRCAFFPTGTWIDIRLKGYILAKKTIESKEAHKSKHDWTIHKRTNIQARPAPLPPSAHCPPAPTLAFNHWRPQLGEPRKTAPNTSSWRYKLKIISSKLTYGKINKLSTNIQTPTNFRRWARPAYVLPSSSNLEATSKYCRKLNCAVGWAGQEQFLKSRNRRSVTRLQHATSTSFSRLHDTSERCFGFERRSATYLLKPNNNVTINNCCENYGGALAKDKITLWKMRTWLEHRALRRKLLKGRREPARTQRSSTFSIPIGWHQLLAGRAATNSSTTWLHLNRNNSWLPALAHVVTSGPPIVHNAWRTPRSARYYMIPSLQHTKKMISMEFWM